VLQVGKRSSKKKGRSEEHVCWTDGDISFHNRVTVKSTSHIWGRRLPRRNINSPVCVDAGLNATPDVEKAAVGAAMAATASMVEKTFIAVC
jgi:hypothetical protein